MNEEHGLEKLEEQKFSEYRKMMVYMKIIKLCGSCVGRIDDPVVEKSLCNTASLLSGVVSSMFFEEEKKAFEKITEDFPRRRKRKAKKTDEKLSGDDVNGEMKDEGPFGKNVGDKE